MAEPGPDPADLTSSKLADQPGLTDAERVALGAQQAALIQIQKIQEVEMQHKAMQQQKMLQEEEQRRLMEAQSKAIAMQQQEILEQENRKIREQQQLQLLQVQALQEKQQEEEQLMRMQQTALIERRHEEQQQQHQVLIQPAAVGGPAAPVQVSMAATSQGAPRPGMQAPPVAAPGPPGSGPPPRQMGPPPPQQFQQMPPRPEQQQQQQGGPPPQQQRPHPPPLMSQPIVPPGTSQAGPSPSQGGPGPFSQSGPPGIRPLMPPRGAPPPMAPGTGDRDLAPPRRDLPPSRMMGPRAGGPPQGMPPMRGPPGVVDEPPARQAEPPQAPEEGRGGGGGPQQPAQPKEMKLPQALEKVLAFKGVRVLQVGVRPEEMERMEKGEFMDADVEAVEETASREEEWPTEEEPAEGEEEEEEEIEPKKPSRKESKNKKRKKKKKRARARKPLVRPQPEEPDTEEPDVEIEYVQDQLELGATEPGYMEFRRIFQMFQIAEPEKPVDRAAEARKAEELKKEEDKKKKLAARDSMADDDDDDDDDEDRPMEEDKPKMSKKKMKKLNRLSVAELKQLVTRPDVVEMHDVTAQDPKLLVSLKATRNTVPVPRHWCFKRKYLQGKRGIEKPPFELPEYIKDTGIMEMREALQEKEDQKTLKAKMRERVRPKMGKIDIDYQKLHDAFFKWQTKPKMSIHGDLYYEGKEFETRLKEKKPGNLSDELRTALGMPLGPNADKYPPPWLIAMQRYGPPPSYPNLKIRGLNAPIPETCSFGYHAGGWGKPPVDENGKPLYGDVFGTKDEDLPEPVQEEEIDKTQWGELESESSEEEESEEEDEETEEPDATGLVTPGETGLITPSGLTSIPVGVETPDMIELRKRRIEDAMDQGGDTPALYQVIPEKKTTVGGAMMGSAHVYDVASATAAKKADKVSTEGIEVALNPEELDLDTAAMQAKYEQTVREQQSEIEKEDLSDMVAEHAAKQKKRKKQQQDSGKSAKKYKEFKF